MPRQYPEEFRQGDNMLSPEFTAQLEALRRAIELQANVAVYPPLTMQQGRTGTTIGRERGHGFWAEYSGTGPAYDCIEKVRDGMGSWASGPRTYTGKCFEASGKTVPVGKILHGEQDDAGNFVGEYNRLVSGGCNYTITVNGCGSPRAGFSVTLGGVTLTTNSSGIALFTSAPTGSQSITVTKTRYASQTVTRTVACNGSTTIFMVPATNYVCCGTCEGPYPNTLFLTDDNGTHTLNWNGTRWIGCYTVSVAGETTSIIGFTCQTPVAGTLNTAIGYVVDCPSTTSGTWGVGQIWYTSGTGAACASPYTNSQCSSGTASPGTGLVACQFRETAGGFGSTAVGNCIPVSFTTSPNSPPHAFDCSTFRFHPSALTE